MEDNWVMEPLKLEVASDAALRVVRSAILDGKLEPGQRIVESLMAEEMEISRSTLREALRRLESEGLVRRVPNKGVFVAELTQDDVEAIHVLREWLEGLAIRLACSHMTAERIDAMKSIVRGASESYRTRDYERVDQLACQFHTNIFKWSGNKPLFKAWKNLYSQVRLCANYLYDTQTDIPVPEEVLTHRDCLDALMSGKPDHAEEVMRRHVSQSRDGLLTMLSSKVNKAANKHELGNRALQTPSSE